MQDIAPELYEKTHASFRRFVKDDKRLQRLKDKAEKGNATWKDAYNFGVYIAEDMQKAIRRNITQDKLPNGKMYYNIAERVVRPLLEEMENEVREYSRKVVTDQNKKAGIGLKAV